MKCVGFFMKDELAYQARIKSLTSNNEKIFSVLESKTFPAVPVSVLKKWIDRELKGGFGIPVEYARNGKGAVYGEGYCSALEELLEELNEKKK